MKRLGQCLLGVFFAALLLLSCRTLVERPSDESGELPPLPAQAAMRSAFATIPEEDVAEQSLPDTVSRRLLPELSSNVALPAGVPVRDGNGIPLKSRSYVRTVYTACRLEETSG